jgi:DNA-directed RNA polymerase specialized sigma24 family protein
MESSRQQGSPSAGAQDTAARLLEEFYRCFRRELTTEVTRLVLRPEVAQEIFQQATVTWIETPNYPTDMDGTRAWFFRVSTNLMTDYRRRHTTVSENILAEARLRAGQNDSFMDESRRMIGTPEMEAIARPSSSPGCQPCGMR